MSEQKKNKRGGVIDSDESENLESPPAVTINVSPVKKRGSEQLPETASKRVVRVSSREPKPKKKNENEMEKYAYELMNEMREYYKVDLEANRGGRPSTQKLDNIDELYSKIIKRETQDACVKIGILDEVKRWMEPLPDRTLPAQKIKKVLLTLLYHLRVTKMDLLRSGVGKIVYFYSQNSREAKDVRKEANDVVNKWKSIIIREETEE
ncbi:transcription factor SPN1 [Enteropsectra breve]|nr:transcription factor SPN1 [Enteropsectra breve]